MKYTILVVKNLFRNKRRTLLTIFSIAVSLFVFAALVSLPGVANKVLADTASSVRIACRTKMGLDYPLPEAYKVKIAATPNVVAVVPDIFFGGIYHDATDAFPNIAIDPENIDRMWPDWGMSQQAIDQFKRIRTSCLVAENTMRHFDLHIGQTIQLRGTHYPFNVALAIVGTIPRGPAPSFLVFRRDYLEEAAGRPGQADNFWVRVDRSESVPKVISSLNRQFENSSAEVQCDSEAVFLGNLIGRYRNFFRLAEILGVIVVLAIGLVAANTAAMSIRERRNEIAIMRSIGFRSSVIRRFLMAESLTISLTGGVLGCGIAYGLLKVLSVSAAALGPFASLSISPVVLTETLAVSALIGLFSAYLPARSASRRNIVDALRMVN